MGKDDRSNVAALHHHSAHCTQLLLQANHPGAYRGKNAHPRGSVGNDLIAQQAGDIFAVKQHAVVSLARFKGNGGFCRKFLQAAALVQRQLRTQRLQSEGAIHGAGFKVEQAEMPGQMPGNCALSSAGWSVNGYDYLPDRSPSRTGSCRPSTWRRPAAFFPSQSWPPPDSWCSRTPALGWWYC